MPLLVNSRAAALARTVCHAEHLDVAISALKRLQFRFDSDLLTKTDFNYLYAPYGALMPIIN